MTLPFAASTTTPTAAHDGLFDERALVEQARSDADAFALLYRTYLPRIYRFAHKRSGSRQVAEDVTSATFERALRSIGQFEWRKAPFEAWLFRIAANQLASYYRTQSRSVSERGQRALGALHVSQHRDETDHVDRYDAVYELRSAMSRLTPRYQEVLSLRYLAGLSDDEASTAMGVTKPLFAVLVHRATAALRREMDRLPKGGSGE